MDPRHATYDNESSDDDFKSPSKRQRRNSCPMPTRRARHSLAARLETLNGSRRRSVVAQSAYETPYPTERLISALPLALTRSPKRIVPFLKSTPRTTRISHAMGFTDQSLDTGGRNKFVDTLLQSVAQAPSKQLRSTDPSPSVNLHNGLYLCLDAPDLRSNFYDNLLTWSHKDILASGLSRKVFTVAMSDCRKVQQLYECPRRNWIESLTWAGPDGPSDTIAVGLDSQVLELVNVAGAGGKVVQRLDSAAKTGGYVGEMSWNGHTLAAGFSDGVIRLFDVRKNGACIDEIRGHRGTARVCGLKWRNDGILLASGGEDNSVNCWDARFIKKLRSTPSGKNEPVHQWIQHGCVKALAWCPWQSNLLATGGGNCDGRIYFRSTSSGDTISTIPLQTQITSLHFSPTTKEILSTTGYYIPSKSTNLRPRLPIPAPGIRHPIRLRPGLPQGPAALGQPNQNFVSRPAHVDHSSYFSSQPGHLSGYDYCDKKEPDSIAYITRPTAKPFHSGRSVAPLVAPDVTPAPRSSILVHRYPDLERVACLPQVHPDRVTLSALSPDGTSLCTTGSDQCLKFWKVWPPHGSKSNDKNGLGSLSSGIIR